jgi:hypothetical protein
MCVGCVEHAGDEGLGLGCKDGSSDMEVGVDRGGWDDEAVAGRLADGRAGVCGGRRREGWTTTR